MISSRLKFFFLFTVICCSALCAQEPAKVACVGNSITYGAGIADQVNDSYPAQLQKLLGDGY
ncbi:hypothetical protein JW998_05320, partial [candidate division KSB1 bacterium]|nr:hypothetical protein [candidate division KSB1 bacterium]